MKMLCIWNSYNVHRKDPLTWRNAEDDLAPKRAAFQSNWASQCLGCSSDVVKPSLRSFLETFSSLNIYGSGVLQPWRLRHPSRPLVHRRVMKQLNLACCGTSMKFCQLLGEENNISTKTNILNYFLIKACYIDPLKLTLDCSSCNSILEASLNYHRNHSNIRRLQTLSTTKHFKRCEQTPVNNDVPKWQVDVTLFWEDCDGSFQHIQCQC